MAQLNTSLADMPWLMQTSDPSEVIARGAAIGSQWAQTNLAKQSLAQRKMEFDQEQALRRAQEERAAALFPLVKTLQQQEVAMKSAQVEDFLRIRQETVEDAGTVGILRQMAGDEMKKGNWMAAMDVVNSGAAQLNRLIDNPQFQQLQKDIGAKAALLMQQQHMNNEAQRYSGAGSTFKPGFGVDINPITKEPMAYFRTGEGSAKLLEDQEGTNVTWEGPGGEKFSMTSGGKGKTTTTKPSEKEMGEATSTAMVMQMGNNLMKGLKPSNVGVAGTVNRTIAKVAGQIPGVKVPEAASEAVDAHTRMLQFNSYMQKTLKPDSNMDKRQVEIILGSLPDPGMIESVDSANRAIQATLRNVAEQQRLGAMSRGRPIPTAYMKPSEIKAAVDAGTMTEEKAREILMNTPYSLND